MSWKKDATSKQHSFPLDNSIRELENLISDKGNIDHDAIPVLDDIIDPDTYVEDEEIETLIDWPDEPDFSKDDNIESGLSQEQLEMLVGKMDQRISGELEELVHILKDALKETIITEIKSQLESNPRGSTGKDSGQESDS